MRRYLVVANQTLASHQLRQELLLRAESGPSLFHFVVPNTPQDQYSAEWSDYEDSIATGAEGAKERLSFALAAVRASGASALGAIGDPDPLKAIELQVQCSNYDEVIVSLLPERSSHWFKQDIPSRIARAVRVPVTSITAKEG